MKLNHASTGCLLLLAGLALGVAGCVGRGARVTRPGVIRPDAQADSAPTPGDSTVPRMTPAEARSVLGQVDPGKMRCTPEYNSRYEEIHGIALTNRQLIIISNVSNYYVPLKRFKVFKNRFFSTINENERRLLFCENSGEKFVEYFDRFASAVSVLQEAADDEISREEAAFENAMKANPATSPRPVVGEDVRRFKVQAEAAVREKHFGEAVVFYERALQIAPHWAEGHFNRALVLSEIGDFETAMVEMKRYLRLEPNATNARAVQDQIYEWEAKAKK
jgi:tetratricopeptide (TPR) repeat protein